MAREITVLLKNEPGAPKPFTAQALGFVNELIKSPIFVFVFGASLGTAYPTLKDWLTPADQLALRHAQDQARADAVLIAPFIGNLDVNKPGQFEAARAALLALEEAASAAGGGQKRPVYAAVNKAIDAVGVQLRPPTDKTQLTATLNRQIESSAQAAPVPAKAKAQDLGVLSKDTLVYIQVSREDPAAQGFADTLLRSLRAASVLAPGIEKMAVASMPQRTQVRYFHEGDKVKAEALAGEVSAVTGGEVFLAKPALEAKPGTLEVWLRSGGPARP